MSRLRLAGGAVCCALAVFSSSGSAGEHKDVLDVCARLAKVVEAKPGHSLERHFEWEMTFWAACPVLTATQRTCVEGAGSTAEARSCVSDRIREYTGVAIRHEAKSNLMNLHWGVQGRWFEDRKPGGKPPPRFDLVSSNGKTPAKSCCAQGGRCAPAADEWSKAPWEQLRFRLDEPHIYQYEIEVAPDGTSYVARAHGNPTCKGPPETWEIRGRIDPSKDELVREFEPRLVTKPAGDSGCGTAADAMVVIATRYLPPAKAKTLRRKDSPLRAAILETCVAAAPSAEALRCATSAPDLAASVACLASDRRRARFSKMRKIAQTVYERRHDKGAPSVSATCDHWALVMPDGESEARATCEKQAKEVEGFGEDAFEAWSTCVTSAVFPKQLGGDGGCATAVGKLRIKHECPKLVARARALRGFDDVVVSQMVDRADLDRVFVRVLDDNACRDWLLEDWSARECINRLPAQAQMTALAERACGFTLTPKAEIARGKAVHPGIEALAMNFARASTKAALRALFPSDDQLKQWFGCSGGLVAEMASKRDQWLKYKNPSSRSYSGVRVPKGNRPKTRPKGTSFGGGCTSTTDLVFWEVEVGGCELDLIGAEGEWVLNKVDC